MTTSSAQDKRAVALSKLDAGSWLLPRSCRGNGWLKPCGRRWWIGRRF
ncbi:hypothetical protein ACIA5C_46025 [Actinoplanes sp. NPDC051343]